MLLFGKSGAGNTSFINYLAGQEIGKVAHILRSEIDTVQKYNFLMDIGDQKWDLTVLDANGHYDSKNITESEIN